MEKYYAQVDNMMAAERPYYTPALIQSLQERFDYTILLSQIDIPVYLLMGDCGQADAIEHISDLHLPISALDKLQIRFVPDSCHMPMIECPEHLAGILIQICMYMD